MSIQNPAADPRMASKIANTLRMMPEDGVELAEFAKMHKADPYLLSLAFNESNFRAAVPRNQQMQGGQNPPVNEQIVANMQAKAAPRQPMPEEVGIGALPERSLARMAGGGIVAFAGGGNPKEKYEQMIREEAQRLNVDPEHMLRLVQAESGFDPKIVSPKKAAGLFQLMPGTARDMGITEQERFNPSKAVPAGMGYFKQLLDRFGGDYEKATAAYNWGPNRRALAKDDWKLALPKETAAYLNRVMPVGAAQAAQPAAAAPAQAAPAQAASTDDGTVYDPMTGVPIYQGTPTTYEESPGKILKQIASPVVKGVTKAAKFITSAPKTAAEIAEEREPFSTGEYRGKSGDVEEDIGPSVKALPSAQKRELIAAAKESVPEGADTKGWTAEDWLTLGFSLLSSKSPRIAEAAGEAGLKVLAGQQARAKTGLEALKTKQDIEASKALARYHTAGAQRYEAEDKPTAQYLKAVDAELIKLVAPNNMTYHMASPAEKQRMEQEARDRVLKTYSATYPDLAATIGGAGGKTGNPLVDKYLS